MKEVVIDTSVWIDFLNGIENRHTAAMTKILDSDTEVFITPQIIQEILQGINNDNEHDQLKEKLLSLNVLSIDPLESAIGASSLYRSLRKKGSTIRKTNDVLIAYYCLYFNIPILHKDRDFEKISNHFRLKIYR